MRYEASEWRMGDLARCVTGNPVVDDDVVRMLIVQTEGPRATERLWWGPNGYIHEHAIRDIERVTGITNEELNRRVEVNP